MEPTALYVIVKNATLFFQPVIFMFGILGNLMSFCLFLSAPMRKVSSNWYLAALSCCNGGFSIVLLVQWLEMVDIPILHTKGVCQATVYLGFVFSFLSAWFVVCIAVENYIIAFHLSKAVTFCTVFRAKIVIVVLTLFSLALYGAVFRVTVVEQVNENVSVCTVFEDFSELNRIYFFLDAALTFALPVLATAIMTSIVLIKNTCQRSKIFNNSRRNYRCSRVHTRLTKITRVLVVISLTYVVSNAPCCIHKLRLVISELFERHYTKKDILLQQLFQLISYVFVVAHVVCYLVFANNFRRRVMKLLCCRDHGKGQSGPSIALRNNQTDTLMRQRRNKIPTNM